MFVSMVLYVDRLDTGLYCSCIVDILKLYQGTNQEKECIAHN
jgi:hypothetical protein